MNLKSLTLLLVLIGLAFPAFSQLITWQFENISDDIEQSGANPELVADGLGNLHVTYWKKSLDRLVYGVRRKGSGTWTFQDVPDAGTFGYKSSLKVNNQGVVYIAYFRNQGGESGLGLATYDGTNWTFEDASEGNTVGDYGYDPSFPTLVQPSLDLNFDAFGQPAILYFNSFYTRIKDCRNDGNIDKIYSQYRMDMNMAVRRGPNVWEEVLFPELPYTGSQPCVENGDRFGEYCKLIKADDTTLLAVTTSMHNNELLLYRTTDDSAKVWDMYVLDQTSRLFSIFNSHFYETFGYIDAQMSSDSLLHLTYNISNHYGYARNIFLGRLTYFYSRVNLNRLDEPTYEPFRFNHTPTTLAAFDNTLVVKGDSNITIGFFERLKSLAISANSTDGGQTWDLDTLSGFATTAPFQAALVEDSVFIAAYFSPGDRLILGRRELSGSAWVLEDITNTQTTGEDLASVVFEENGNRRIFVATQGEETDRLLFGEKMGNSWDFEEVDVTGGGLKEVSLCLDPQNNPILVYFAEDSTEIRMATRISPGDWNIEIISDSILAKDLSATCVGGNMHLLFFNLNGGYLEQYSLPSGQSTWSSTVVDSSSSIVGSNAKLSRAVDGTLHVAYLDLINQMVKYAFLTPGGTWSTEGITIPATYNAKNVAIALDTFGLASIVFADGPKDTLFLATQEQNTWRIDRLEGDFTDFSGDELSLLIDGQNQPWVLYNYQTFIEDLRLFYRQADDSWKQISITNNQAEISNSFNFHLVEEDLYIIGKKNQINNQGLGLLFAERGLLADLEKPQQDLNWQIAPNPSRGLTKIIWEGTNLRSAEVELYNLSGQRLYHKELNGISTGEETPLNLQGLVPGIYLVRVSSPEQTSIRRLILTP